MTKVITADRQAGVEVDADAVLSGILERESSVAGALLRLGSERSPSQIAELMKSPAAPDETAFVQLLDMVTPAESDLVNATISPIGLVRLYRQYFFEFDTFLGPPVQHLWLSPGGVVELVEVSTRRTLIERTTEHAIESFAKTETSSTDKDELNIAVRSENSENTKLGVTLNVTGDYDVGFVSGSTAVGTSFNTDQSSKNARETTHRTLHEQAQKLSTEIRQNFKSTFKTITETTDTQSRRYVLNNTTPFLVNYELRRKMRQVGVQVQDYGLHLCWQAYVDTPGEELGIAKLIHIAAPADLQGIKEPDGPVMPEAEIKDKPLPVPSLTYQYLAGWVISAGFHQLGLNIPITPPKQGYIYSRAEVVRTSTEVELTPLRAYPQNR